jgi:hypothetical protein
MGHGHQRGRNQAAQECRQQQPRMTTNRPSHRTDPYPSALYESDQIARPGRRAGLYRYRQGSVQRTQLRMRVTHPNCIYGQSCHQMGVYMVVSHVPGSQSAQTGSHTQRDARWRSLRLRRSHRPRGSQFHGRRSFGDYYGTRAAEPCDQRANDEPEGRTRRSSQGVVTPLPLRSFAVLTRPHSAHCR